MAKIRFESKKLRRHSGGMVFDPEIKPPDLDLPWYWRVAKWALKPFVPIILRWAQDCIEQLLEQSAGVLADPLKELLDDVIRFLIRAWEESA